MKQDIMTIEKTDAHHHLWSLGSPHHPMLTAPGAKRFFGNTQGLKHDFGAERFKALAAGQNVTRSVYVESHFSPAIDETGHVDAIARQHGFPHAIIGRVDLGSPGLAQDLDIHLASPLFKGVRMMMNWDPDPLIRAGADQGVMLTPQWRDGYAELGRRGLSVEIMAMPAQLRELIELATAYPHTPLIIGHAGLPFARTPQERDTWREGMAALAGFPHVSVKLSGLGMVDHHWSAASIAPIVLYLIDLFTPARCMFASNFPVDGLHASYDAVWDAFDTITATLSDADRNLLFRDTARRIYRLA